MKKRGDGTQSGRDKSIERADAAQRIQHALEDIEFPVKRDDLLARTKDVTWLETKDGTRYTVADALTDIPVDEFSSPRHVTEALRMRWDDEADIIRPGGTGPHRAYGSRGPQEDSPGARAERASPEFDDYTHAEAAGEPGKDAKRKSGQ